MRFMPAAGASGRPSPTPARARPDPCPAVGAPLKSVDGVDFLTPQVCSISIISPCLAAVEPPRRNADDTAALQVFQDPGRPGSGGAHEAAATRVRPVIPSRP